MPGAEPGRVAVPETTGSQPGDEAGGKDDEKRSRDRDRDPGPPPPPKPPVKFPPLYRPPNSSGTGAGGTALPPGTTSSSVPSGGITSEPVQTGAPSGGDDAAAGSAVVPGNPPKTVKQSWPVESVRVTSDDVAVVPLRRTFQPMGAVIWTGQGYVWAKMRGHTVRMKIGSAQAMVYQGDDHELRQWRKAVFLYRAEVYVPLRDTCDALGVAISEVNHEFLLR
jgi:hypothetical protein